MKFIFVRMAQLLSIVVLVYAWSGCGMIPIHMGSARGFSAQGADSGQAYYLYLSSRIQFRQGQPDRAIMLLQKAIEADPESVFLRYELAGLLVSQQEFQSALDIIQSILERRPEDVDALLLLGRIHQSLEQPDEAKKVYERVIVADPKQENTYVLLGKIYIDAGEKDDALRIYQRLVTHFPGSYLGHFFIGKLLSERGMAEAAEEEFKRTIELAPALEEPYFELLKLYEQQGRQQDKLAIYNEVLARDPNNAEIQMELALYYANAGENEQSRAILFQLGQRSLKDRTVIPKIAQQYLEKESYSSAIIIIDGMLKAAPDSSDLCYLMGLAKDGNGEKNAAIDYLKRVEPDSRFFEGAVIHAAFLYQELGRTLEAIDFIKDIILKTSPTADLLFYLGAFYEENENYIESEAAFLQGLKIAPENVRILFRLAVLYDKKGDREAAIRGMKSVIRIDPNHTNALNYLGYTYAEMGIFLDEAEQLVLKALETEPDDGYIIDSLAWVYYKKGAFDRAVSLLEKAVSLVPDDPTILEHLADAYLKVNDKDKALRYYRRSLEKKDKDKQGVEEKIRKLTEKDN